MSVPIKKQFTKIARENAYAKLPGEPIWQQKFFDRPIVFWPIALFFFWASLSFLLLTCVLEALDKFAGAEDPICPYFFIPYAIIGPIAACILLRKTQQHTTSFLWAVLNVAFCPFALILWLFALIR